MINCAKDSKKYISNDNSRASDKTFVVEIEKKNFRNKNENESIQFELINSVEIGVIIVVVHFMVK